MVARLPSVAAELGRTSVDGQLQAVLLVIHEETRSVGEFDSELTGSMTPYLLNGLSFDVLRELRRLTRQFVFSARDDRRFSAPMRAAQRGPELFVRCDRFMFRSPVRVDPLPRESLERVAALRANPPAFG